METLDQLFCQILSNFVMQQHFRISTFALTATTLQLIFIYQALDYYLDE